MQCGGDSDVVFESCVVGSVMWCLSAMWFTGWDCDVFECCVVESEM